MTRLTPDEYQAAQSAYAQSITDGSLSLRSCPATREQKRTIRQLWQRYKEERDSEFIASGSRVAANPLVNADNVEGDIASKINDGGDQELFIVGSHVNIRGDRHSVHAGQKSPEQVLLARKLGAGSFVWVDCRSGCNLGSLLAEDIARLTWGDQESSANVCDEMAASNLKFESRRMDTKNSYAVMRMIGSGGFLNNNVVVGKTGLDMQELSDDRSGRHNRISGSIIRTTKNAIDACIAIAKYTKGRGRVFFHCDEKPQKSMIMMPLLYDFVRTIPPTGAISLARCMNRFHELRMRNSLVAPLDIWPQILLTYLSKDQKDELFRLIGSHSVVHLINNVLFSEPENRNSPAVQEIYKLCSIAFANLVTRVQSKKSSENTDRNEAATSSSTRTASSVTSTSTTSTASATNTAVTSTTSSTSAAASAASVVTAKPRNGAGRDAAASNMSQYGALVVSSQDPQTLGCFARLCAFCQACRARAADRRAARRAARRGGQFQSLLGAGSQEPSRLRTSLQVGQQDITCL